MTPRRAIDEKAKTIDLSFSSETRVERWFGVEILDHSPAAVRLGRLNDGGPLLLDHRTTNENHIGAIQRAYIEDGKGRAVARFADTPESNQVFDMVRDGIKRHVSVGYRVHKVILEEQSDEGPDVYRVTDWEPVEISLVSVPADVSVGVGRADSSDYPMHLIRDLNPMKDQKPETPTPVEPAREVDVKAVENRAAEAARKTEIDRIRNINAIAEMNKENRDVKELAAKCIEDGTPLAEFQSRVIPLLGRAQPLPLDNDPVTKLGLEKKEIKNFSILRAVRAIVAAQQEGANPNKIAPFELECSRAIQERLDRAPRGFFVPFDVQRGQRLGPRRADGHQRKRRFSPH